MINGTVPSFSWLHAVKLKEYCCDPNSIRRVNDIVVEDQLLDSLFAIISNRSKYAAAFPTPEAKTKAFRQYFGVNGWNIPFNEITASPLTAPSAMLVSKTPMDINTVLAFDMTVRYKSKVFYQGNKILQHQPLSGPKFNAAELYENKFMPKGSKVVMALKRSPLLSGGSFMSGDARDAYRSPSMMSQSMQSVDQADDDDDDDDSDSDHSRDSQDDSAWGGGGKEKHPQPGDPSTSEPASGIVKLARMVSKTFSTSSSAETTSDPPSKPPTGKSFRRNDFHSHIPLDKIMKVQTANRKERARASVVKAEERGAPSPASPRKSTGEKFANSNPMKRFSDDSYDGSAGPGEEEVEVEVVVRDGNEGEGYDHLEGDESGDIDDALPSYEVAVHSDL